MSKALQVKYTSIIVVLSFVGWFVSSYFSSGASIGASVFFSLIGVAGIGISCSLALKKIGSPAIASLFVFGAIILSIAIPLTIMPLESGPRAFQQLANYYNVYQAYPNGIKYEDIALGEAQQRVAAITKYRNSLPETMAVLTVYDRVNHKSVIRQRIAIEMRNSILVYDPKAMTVSENGTNKQILVINPGTTQELRCNFDIRGYMKWSLEKPAVAQYVTQTTWLGLAKVRLSPRNGAEYLFNRALLAWKSN